MSDLAFAGRPATVLPRHRQATLAIAAVMHIVLFAALAVAKTAPLRISSPGSSYAGIAAYVAPRARASMRRAAAPRTTAPATTAATAAPTATEASTDAPTDAPQAEPADTASAAGSPNAVGGQSTGPVRLASGTLTLLKKVSPMYPSVMQSAHVPGFVVLDAVIHSDGTIGDVTVLRSTNDLFARAAIEAVKKWRYTPMPYEGIVTVTVNFTLT